MIKTMAAMRAAMRAKKRQVQAANVIVEVKKRRRPPSADDHQRQSLPNSDRGGQAP